MDDLTRADYERLAAFRYTLRRFLHFSAEAAQAAGLSAQQHQALLAIKGHTDGALTVGGLAERLLIAPHSAAELVMRLEEADLVSKARDAGDRRRIGLNLTERAEMALRTLSTQHLRELRTLAPRWMTMLRDLERAMAG